ncbi:MarR family winged helix-turn-helix transcriptional regulator [Intestinibacter sp.]|uniref:MarR family winged helix-turn-helix transcriptional regulator n=1 Tax=Intestinibacter sp. TaxID=1965304 RepID=UPI003F174DBC
MKPKDACGFLIKQIHTTLEKNANNALRESGLTTAQVSVLMELYDTVEKQMTLKELEKVLHLAQSTTAGIVSRLVQKGLVECYADVSDKRIKIVKITPAGEECCIVAEKHMQEAEEDLLSGLTETERDIFVSLLKKVSTSMK